MPTTETTTTITPKYDPHYNVTHAVQGMRLMAEILGTILQRSEEPDPAALVDFFDSMNEQFLYTLGWLENQRTAVSVDDPHANAVQELMNGVRLLLTDTFPIHKKEGLDLGDVATTILECAYALEEYAKHIGIQPPEPQPETAPRSQLAHSCIEIAKNLFDMRAKVEGIPQLAAHATRLTALAEFFERMGIHAPTASFDETTMRTLRRLFPTVAIKIQELFGLVAKFYDEKRPATLDLYTQHASEKIAKLTDLTMQAAKLFDLRLS